MTMISRSLAMAILCLSLLGCGGAGDLPTVAKVKGTVTYKGVPLESGTIVFYPASSRSATGEIHDGEFLSLTTFEPDDGAPLGEHTVTVQAFDTPVIDMDTKRKSPIPTKYGDVKTTVLSVEITAGENTVEFDLVD